MSDDASLGENHLSYPLLCGPPTPPSWLGPPSVIHHPSISHASVMPQSCISHASVMHQSCLSHASVMHQSCLSHASVIHPLRPSPLLSVRSALCIADRVLSFRSCYCPLYVSCDSQLLAQFPTRR